jgi:uncharacterized peroxidase-related enzyme
MNVAHFESMPKHSRMRDMVMRFPEKGAVLMSLGELFLRGTSELSHAEKEILFAYGSALNDCNFCHLSHKYTAAQLGVDEFAFDQLLVSIDDAPIDEKLKPLVRYVQKLSLTPSQMNAADVASVRAAGWSEDAIFDAICICGFNNLMNRVVDATGIESTEEELRESGHRLATLGYDGSAAKALDALAANKMQ